MQFGKVNMDNYRFYLPTRVRCLKSIELDFSHFRLGALLLSWFDSESLLFPVDMEPDFSSPNINLCVCGAKKGPPKNEGRLCVFLHVKHHKVN